MRGLKSLLKYIEINHQSQTQGEEHTTRTYKDACVFFLGSSNDINYPFDCIEKKQLNKHNIIPSTYQNTISYQSL